ncbi:DUF3592 domain-containing protein [Nocardia carnea]|uniref:DUF3592 domain-containing protein n=1 Tax=Nocardia carnea TaxID=37328 RepID=UPI0024559BD4|nr:DUF3592 domain-containing protein [Nocardia carnea]
MSPIETSTRRDPGATLCRVVGYVCSGAAVCAFLAVGWSTGETLGAGPEYSTPGRVVAVALPAGIMALVAGVFALAAGTESPEFEPRIVFSPLAAVFVAHGAGGIAHGVLTATPPPVLSVGFTAAGAAAMVAVEVIARAMTRNRRLPQRVRTEGRATTGRVTRASRRDSDDGARSTRVTVEFTDHAGRTRRTSGWVDGVTVVNTRIQVRYLPEFLDHRAGVVVGEN